MQNYLYTQLNVTYYVLRVDVFSYIGNRIDYDQRWNQKKITRSMAPDSGLRSHHVNSIQRLKDTGCKFKRIPLSVYANVYEVNKLLTLSFNR